MQQTLKMNKGFPSDIFDFEKSLVFSHEKRLCTGSQSSVSNKLLAFL